MDFLKGWKTTIGAISLVLGGLAVILKGLSTEAGIDFEMVIDAGTMIMAGLAVFGIGKKIERNGK